MLFRLFLFCLSSFNFFAARSSAKNEGGAAGVDQEVLRWLEESRRTKFLGRHACDGHVGAVQDDEEF